MWCFTQGYEFSNIISEDCSKQTEAIKRFELEKDTFVSSPMAYGNHALLPFLFDYVYMHNSVHATDMMQCTAYSISINTLAIT